MITIGFQKVNQANEVLQLDVKSAVLNVKRRGICVCVCTLVSFGVFWCASLRFGVRVSVLCLLVSLLCVLVCSYRSYQLLKKWLNEKL